MEYPNDWEKFTFQSHHLHSGEYSPSRREARIKFGHEGIPYSYQLPPEIWNELKKAGHPGQYFAANIKPHFNGKRITK